MTTAVGVDGCKAGWFYLRRDGKKVSHGIATSFQQLVGSLPSSARIFIDIPIGLSEGERPNRRCDVGARQLISPRGSTIFPAPCRQALHAQNYEEAKRLSQQTIGTGLSKQAFAIIPKIKEVDEYLLNNDAPVSIREVHPEVCFWALNERQPVLSKKKTVIGFRERLALLKKMMPDVRPLVDEILSSYLRKQVARDDILDALVALVVACTADADLHTVPASPDRDQRGLPMEMVFAETTVDHVI